MTAGSDTRGTVPVDIDVAPKEVYVFPASFAQRRLWFLERLGTGSAYTIAHTGSFELRGRLDVEALRSALAQVVLRHESLRTTFREIDGEPQQVIDPRGAVELEIVDLTALAAKERDAEVERLALDAEERPFDLEAGPLSRFRLLRLEEERHALLLSLHHAISDGWSMGVLFRDLGVLYSAFREGRPSPLAELEIQVPDVAVWERERLEGERLQALLSYWTKRLGNAPDVRLPADREPPPAPTFRGAQVPLEVPAELVTRLGTLGRDEGATSFMVLLAGFFAMLHRQTESEDLVVGAPIANRRRREMEDLIGFFVNVLPLRVGLSGAVSFRGLVGRVRNACLGAYEHQELPFERLVEELRPGRSADRHPLFQVAFALQDIPGRPLELAGLEVEPLALEMTTARFDLECHLWTRGDRVGGNLIFATDRFEVATVERLARRYVRLLEAVAEDPDLALSRVPLSDELEERVLLTDWNGVVTDYPRDRTLHGLFEECVRERPSGPALRGAGEDLTYGELDERANRLARHLLASGMAPGAPVGLFLDSSADAVVVQLAVLKAGGAYLPLDPDWPRRRLQWTVADARPELIATRSELSRRITGIGARLLELDRERSAIDAQPSDPPGVESGPEDGAYVMYTSGSTGEPKGVVIPHRAVVRLVRDTDYLTIGSEDVVLQLGSLTFDASTFEIWAALLHGALLVIFPIKDLSLPALGEAVRDHRVTTALIPTPLFHQVVDHELRGLTGLRQLLTGGDVLSPDHARRALEGLRDCPLINAYGPTEGAVITCCHRMEDASDVGGSVPIGRPIANTRVYVLDKRRQLSPLGAIGELAIGGDGLARGYLGRPRATAELFVPDPFTDEPGARLYLTGDLARWTHDGRLEFHGRRDLQIKVRGVRVEPAEIESILLAHPEVESAAVAGRVDSDEGHHLVAWVVPRSIAGEGDAERPGELVAEWRDLFEETYGGPAAAPPAKDFAGWNSSYTGEPIPPQEMAEWVDETVARISAFRPRRVLEIGCGTGLLLLRLARTCSAYVGTDFSAAALDRLRGQIASLGASGLGAVRLVQRSADDFAGIDERSMDAVVLNSVVQYFPDTDYLVTVLERAVAATEDGGVVFVGDVRDHSLQRAFHTSVALHRAAADATLEEVADRAAERLELEPELVLHPAFFARLPDRLSRVTGVEIRPKLGRHVNELTAYRYDVALRVGTAPEAATVVTWRERGDREWSEERVEEELAGLEDSETLGIRGVVDPRLERDLAALRWIDRAQGRHTVAELEEELADGPRATLPPARLREIAGRHGRAVELAWAGPGSTGRFDVLFEGPSDGAVAPLIPLPGVLTARDEPEPAAGLANVPLALRPANTDLVPRLRQFLAERLPAPMVPATILTLRRMPRGATGKIDRNALPSPEASAGEAARSRAPRDDVEAALLEVWEHVLGRTGIGTRDDFFELGGHSLLGVRLVSEVEKKIGRRVPLRSLFRFSTVERMADLLRDDDRSEAPIGLAGEFSLSSGEVRDLLAAMASSQLEPLEPGSLLAGFHRAGSKPPLFWCFNVPSFEPARLADRLDDEQPLYAMLSGVGVLDWGTGTPAALAAYYLDRILAVQPEGPYRLGGNCGGGRVALALARLLRGRGARVERLCLLEHFEPMLYRHPEPMLLLYGRESHLEVHRDFRWGEPGWEEPFVSPPRVEWIPGAHGEFFDPENVGALAAAISAFLGD